MQSFRPVVERYVRRDRLLDLLPSDNGYVVWLEAPYGYGKSVLASQWARDLEADGWRSLWLAPKSDLLKLLAEALAMPAEAPPNAVLDELTGVPTLVVLEDLEAFPEHEALTPLLRDGRLLILLASRGAVNSSELPRLYTSGRLVHLRAEDLAFTAAETLDLIPDAEVAHGLWERTNGWPLPLHFASLAGDTPEGAALLEGMRDSLTTAEWEEALFLATVSFLPPEAAVDSTRALAGRGFVQLGEAGYRLHALVAEAILASHGPRAITVLRREGGRLTPLQFGEACARSKDLESLAQLFEEPRKQAYRKAPERYLQWHALLGGQPTALRRVTVGAIYKVLGRHHEAVAELDEALASGELVANDELLALKDLCWSLALTDPDRAIAVVERGEQLLDRVDPELAGRFLSDASFVDMMAERFDDADTKLERALEYLPRDNLYRTGARINLALNRWDRHGDLDGRLVAQIETLPNVWHLYPSDAPGQCRDIAMMYWWLGDKGRAREFLQQALEGEKSNPLVELEAAAALGALDGDSSVFASLLERAVLLGDAYTMDIIAMHALNTLPQAASPALADSFLAAVPTPVLSAAAYALDLDARGEREAALTLLEPLAAEYGQRPYQLYLRAARYRITRDPGDLELFLSTTTAGPRVLPGLIPVTELPPERPELSLHYALRDVLESGWREAVELRLQEIPDLELNLLGSFELRALGRPLELTDRQKQIVALFALGKSREEVAEAVWPEADVSKQRNNMGVQISHLRKVLEPWGVTTFLFENGLRRLHCDHDDLLVALAAEDAERVFRLYREPLAPGVTVEAMVEHRNWLREEVVACLGVGAESASAVAALRYLGRVIELDPLNEEAVRSLLTHLLRRGRKADARRHYQLFAQRLRDEMGLEPLAETSELLGVN